MRDPYRQNLLTLPPHAVLPARCNRLQWAVTLESAGKRHVLAHKAVLVPVGSTDLPMRRRDRPLAKVPILAAQR